MAEYRVNESICHSLPDPLYDGTSFYSKRIEDYYTGAGEGGRRRVPQPSAVGHAPCRSSWHTVNPKELTEK